MNGEQRDCITATVVQQFTFVYKCNWFQWRLNIFQNANFPNRSSKPVHVSFLQCKQIFNEALVFFSTLTNERVNIY